MFNPGKLELQNHHKMLGLLSDLSVLLVNKNEASQLVPGTTLEELLSHLHNYVSTVIITNGNQGAIATDDNQILRIGLYEDVRVKDTTGAGDAFGSGFLAAYAAGKSFQDSLIFASGDPGAQTVVYFIWTFGIRRSMYGLAAAASTLLTITIMVITVVQFRISDRWVFEG